MRSVAGKRSPSKKRCINPRDNKIDAAHHISKAPLLSSLFEPKKQPKAKATTYKHLLATRPSNITAISTPKKLLATARNIATIMPGTKISPAKLAQSSASAKKIKELEKKADIAKKAATLKSSKKKGTPPKAAPPPKPIVEEKREDEPPVFDQKKASKVHYSHDEKRHMKYVRNKIRDGVDLSEEEIVFATNHQIELAKAKTKGISDKNLHQYAHHGKSHDTKKVGGATKGHEGKGNITKAKKH